MPDMVPRIICENYVYVKLHAKQENFYTKCALRELGNGCKPAHGPVQHVILGHHDTSCISHTRLKRWLVLADVRIE